MDDIAIARALHVVSVVIWIGGVTFMTMIILPAIRRDEFGEDWLKAFRSAERRFVRVARIAALIVGATGFYIVGRLDLWQRFASARFWWMHAMLAFGWSSSSYSSWSSPSSSVDASMPGRWPTRERHLQRYRGAISCWSPSLY